MIFSTLPDVAPDADEQGVVGEGFHVGAVVGGPVEQFGPVFTGGRGFTGRVHGGAVRLDPPSVRGQEVGEQDGVVADLSGE